MTDTKAALATFRAWDAASGTERERPDADACLGILTHTDTLTKALEALIKALEVDETARFSCVARTARLVETRLDVLCAIADARKALGK